jgi:hypothetical protein
MTMSPCPNGRASGVELDKAALDAAHALNR